MFWRRKSVLNTQEAGKSISADNMKKVQGIHDTSSDMGADCASPIWSGVYESARIWEAALPMNSSMDAIRYTYMPNALSAHLGVKDTYDEKGPYIQDIMPNHVVYKHKGETNKLKYSLTHGTGGADPSIKFTGDPKKVHTAYVDTTDATEALLVFLTDMPADVELVSERYISKATRDAADSKDFAGKHKSFPILEAGDVDAALKSIGRAGSDNYDAATLKSNILSIAKRKGFTTPTESVLNTLAADELMVSESAEWCIPAEQVVEFLTAGAKEAVATGKPTVIPIKIIGPGQGSMAFYSKEMISSSGPGVFTKGTHMYWNHPTPDQEAQRPEGDLRELAAVLTENAQWENDGPKGPGLYSKAKVFSDYAQQVQEKGAHIGISINTPIKFTEGEVDGKHVRIAKEFIKSPLTSADFVTRAGAKGAPVVTAHESAGGSQITKETTMTLEEEKALRDELAASRAANQKFQEGANVELAVTAVSSVLREAAVPYNEKVVRRLCSTPVMKEGQPDPDWVKSICTDLCEGITGKVTGMGRTTEAVSNEVTEKEVKAYENVFSELGMTQEAAKIAVKGVD